MFEGAQRLEISGNTLVILPNARAFRADLEAQEDRLLRLATYARGWDEAELNRMRAVFKIDPFYEASGLVLIFRGEELLGTAGVDTSILSDDRAHILHLCSVNFHPAIQQSGLIAFLFVLLADYVIATLPAENQLYLTSISQSPLVYSLMAKLAPVHPNGVVRPAEDIVAIARRVARKYDPHLSLEPETLALRGECDFFYRRLPQVADQRINALFGRLLDVPAGDVFVNVASTRVGTAAARISRYRRRFSALAMEGIHAAPHQRADA